VKQSFFAIYFLLLTFPLCSGESKSPENIITASNEQGLKLLNQGDLKSAEKIFIRTFSDCHLFIQKNPSDRQIKKIAEEVLGSLNLIWIKQGNYGKGKENLLQLYKPGKYTNTFAGALIDRSLASVYQALGEYDSSLFYANQALSVAQALEESTLSGMIYTDIGTTYYYMGKCSDALDYYEQARGILQGDDDKLQLAKLYNNMASTYKQISYYEKATNFFLESARLKEQLADSDGLAATYNNLGLVYFDWDNNDMTSLFLKKAISINLKRNNKKYLATNYTALGDLFVDLKQSDSAIFYYKKSLGLKKELGNKYGIVISLHCLGDVYADMLLNESLAIQYYQQALDLANSIGSGYEIASVNSSLGVLMYNKGRVVAANGLFVKAYEYANQENALDLIHKCSRYLTEISIQRGDKASAREYFSRFRTTGDSLFNEDKTRTILEMQTRFETEKHEQANLTLQKTNNIQKSQIKFLIGISVILLLLGFTILY
jgi:tetratricopeptide (TPR) repeat protein